MDGGVGISLVGLATSGDSMSRGTAFLQPLAESYCVLVFLFCFGDYIHTIRERLDWHTSCAHPYMRIYSMFRVQRLPITSRSWWLDVALCSRRSLLIRAEQLPLTVGRIEITRRRNQSARGTRIIQYHTVG